MILLFAGCPQSSDKISKPGSTQSGTTIHGEKIDISETELLTALNLTRGSQSASEAAKKIAAQTGKNVGRLSFTEAKSLAYDDEAGTFKVKVVGKKNGKNFDKTFNVTGFTHPYASPPQSAIQVEFKFDAGIEENLSIDKYIEKITPNLKAHLTFSFSLQNGKAITLGYDNDYYELTAQVSNSNGELKISPEYKLKYKKKLRGEDETSVSTAYTSAMPVFTGQKKDYFTEKDVFEHIFNKVKDDPELIVADAGSYASSKYAFAMVLNNGGTLFNTGKIAQYVNVYNTKGADNHREIKNITPAMDNVRGGGITADDYEGKLTVNFYISKAEYIADGNTPDDKEKSGSYTVVRSGFKKLPSDISSNVRSVLEFSLGKITDGNGTQDTWKKRRINNTALISMKYTGINSTYDNWFSLNDDLKITGDTSGFYLILNGQDYTSRMPNHQDNFLVPTNGDENVKILIKHLQISKNVGEEELTIRVQFMGGNDTETVKIKPQSY
ncbi:lipoprotein 17-related variable surface protein [Treponema sp. HNW]|uniref:lipoprotein 17-related variable surface protein n=1 Tax=Treponema sp. HNW TaxID=3116654 RepID=UPI003D12C69F